jgi:hypothetical protein
MMQRSASLAVILSLTLVFVWSLPATIALRWLLMLVALVALTIAMGRDDWRRLGLSARIPLLALAALTAWLVVQTILISTSPGQSLAEVRGQWLPALLAFALGLMLGLKSLGRTARFSVATWIVLVLAAQAALAIGDSFRHWLFHAEPLRQMMRLTGGKLEMSFVLDMLWVFLLTEFYCRASRMPSLLGLSLPILIALSLILAACSYLAGARSGMVNISVMTAAALLLYFADRRHQAITQRRFIALVAILAATAALAVAQFQADPRWRTATETATIAWRIDQHRQWLEGSPDSWPRLSDGSIVDHSNYVRVAFIRAGLTLIAEHPEGVGYGRNAFGHAFANHYGLRVGHAHSGWIDLGIGGGIPALLLWLTFLASLMLLGGRAAFVHGNPAGMALMLLVTSYAFRMTLDSVSKDHMLQMFMFLAGMLLVLTAPRQTEAGP